MRVKIQGPIQQEALEILCRIMDKQAITGNTIDLEKVLHFPKLI